MDKPILKKRKDLNVIPEKPILKKRKDFSPLRLCGNIIDDGVFSGKEKICGRPVLPPNRFLCQICLRHTESPEQTMGYEL